MNSTRLTRLRVKGYRSLRDVDVGLEALNVLIGANGAGKSNILGLLRMLGYAMNGDLQVHVARQGAATSVLRYGPKRTPEMSVELDYSEGTSSFHYGLTLGPAATDQLLVHQETLAERRTGEVAEPSRNYSVQQLESVVPGLAREPDSPKARAARSLVDMLGRIQLYHVHDTTPASPIRLTQDVDRNRVLLEDGRNLASFLHMLRHAHGQYFDLIVDHARLVLPFLKSLVLEPEALNSKSILLRWRDHNPDYEFGPHQLSDGSLRVIALITLLLQPVELRPPVILIDEPELGLHPQGVSLIASLVKAASQDTQVIVATQSPRFLAEFEPEDVLVVEREADEQGFGESTIRRLDAQRLAAWKGEYDLGTLFEMNITGGAPQ